MSGHSKWAQIRRSKGVNDARRGQLFTRLGREIVVAVREGGGGDSNANFRLRIAVQRARDANMPMDNIERTIKRAMGSGEDAPAENGVDVLGWDFAFEMNEVARQQAATAKIHRPHDR